MNKVNAPLDRLKEIILLYANTPHDPIENLRLIEKALLDPFYLDASNPCQIWEHVQSQTVVSFRIETVIRMHDIGLAGAQSIHGNQASQDEFMTGVVGHVATFPPLQKERFRKLWESAFYEVYGYSVASTCPCSLTKMNVLAEEDFVTPDEDLRKSAWTKERLNCLECDHLHFRAILKNLTTGHYRHLSEILNGYRKTSTETATSWNVQQPIGKIIFAYEYEENRAAFPGYLDGLPCNILIDFLSSGSHAKNIKHCPICEKFFFAKDTKRMVCYENPQCDKDFTIYEKWWQREDRPEKYGSSKPLEVDNPAYNRLKAIWEGKKLKKLGDVY
jgi:hypothetical protein